MNTTAPQDDFPQKGLAWRTLIVSAISLALAFCVWFMWSAITVKLNDCGFNFSPTQLFWLAAMPVILGSLLRIPYGVIVSRYGSCRSYAFVTFIMLIPCVGTGLAVQNTQSSYWLLLFWATLTGLAGANFATSMATVTLWFPKRMQGTALGINGLGNLGVTIAQFTVPAVIVFAIFGGLGGDPLSMVLKTGGTKPIYLQNAAYIWIPFIIICGLAILFLTKDFQMQPKTVSSQLKVRSDKHTWILSYIYFLTFGCFVAMGASLPLLIKEVFIKAPGGAPNPLVYAPWAPFIGTIMRPIGGWLSDKIGAGRVTATAIIVMAVCGFVLPLFVSPSDFRNFFTLILVICAAAGMGNGSVFKIIPTINQKEAGAVVGFVSCVGALGGFFPPILLGWCLKHMNGSPALAYVLMALFAVSCFVLNWWYYWRKKSPTYC